MAFVLLLPLSPIFCCCMSSLSSLMLFGDKLPVIGPQIDAYKPYFLGSTGSSMCSSVCICVLIIILSFWVLNTGTEAFLSTAG